MLSGNVYNMNQEVLFYYQCMDSALKHLLKNKKAASSDPEAIFSQIGVSVDRETSYLPLQQDVQRWSYEKI